MASRMCGMVGGDGSSGWSLLPGLARAGAHGEGTAHRSAPVFVGEGGVRSRLAALLAGPTLVAGSWVAGAAARARLDRLGPTVERTVGRVLEKLAGVRLDVQGRELVNPSEHYIVVPLHEGFADALALLRLPLVLRFLARDELFGWPGLGRYLEAGRHPRVSTTSSVSSVRRLFKAASSVFRRGESLVVFAQGSVLGVEVAFAAGPLALAKRFDRPILPVVLTGSHRVWEHPFSPTMRTGERISMRVLPPTPADGLDRRSFRELERTMKRVALGPAMAPARRFEPDRDGWWDAYPFAIDPDFPGLLDRVVRHRALEGISREERGSPVTGRHGNVHRSPTR